MGKTYKDSRNFNPADKPKNKGSQKNKRLKTKTQQDTKDEEPTTN